MRRRAMPQREVPLPRDVHSVGDSDSRFDGGVAMSDSLTGMLDAVSDASEYSHDFQSVHDDGDSDGDGGVDLVGGATAAAARRGGDGIGTSVPQPPTSSARRGAGVGDDRVPVVAALATPLTSAADVDASSPSAVAALGGGGGSHSDDDDDDGGGSDVSAWMSQASFREEESPVRRATPRADAPRVDVDSDDDFNDGDLRDGHGSRRVGGDDENGGTLHDLGAQTPPRPAYAVPVPPLALFLLAGLTADVPAPASRVASSPSPRAPSDTAGVVVNTPVSAPGVLSPPSAATSNVTAPSLFVPAAVTTAPAPAPTVAAAVVTAAASASATVTTPSTTDEVWSLDSSRGSGNDSDLHDDMLLRHAPFGDNSAGDGGVYDPARVLATAFAAQASPVPTASRRPPHSALDVAVDAAHADVAAAGRRSDATTTTATSTSPVAAGPSRARAPHPPLDAVVLAVDHGVAAMPTTSPLVTAMPLLPLLVPVAPPRAVPSVDVLATSQCGTVDVPSTTDVLAVAAAAVRRVATPGSAVGVSADVDDVSSGDDDCNGGGDVDDDGRGGAGRRAVAAVRPDGVHVVVAPVEHADVACSPMTVRTRSSSRSSDNSDHCDVSGNSNRSDDSDSDGDGDGAIDGDGDGDGDAFDAPTPAALLTGVVPPSLTAAVLDAGVTVPMPSPTPLVAALVSPLQPVSAPGPGMTPPFSLSSAPALPSPPTPPASGSLQPVSSTTATATATVTVSPWAFPGVTAPLSSCAPADAALWSTAVGHAASLPSVSSAWLPSVPPTCTPTRPPVSTVPCAHSRQQIDAAVGRIRQCLHGGGAASAGDAPRPVQGVWSDGPGAASRGVHGVHTAPPLCRHRSLAASGVVPFPTLSSLPTDGTTRYVRYPYGGSVDGERWPAQRADVPPRDRRHGHGDRGADSLGWRSPALAPVPPAISRRHERRFDSETLRIAAILVGRPPGP